MTDHLVRSFAFVLALGSSFAVVPSCADAPATCEVGSPGCPCAVGTCASGLICINDVCVFPGGGTAVDTAGIESTTAADPTAADETSAGGPSVFSLDADGTSLSPNQVVTFTAQVTHPEGLGEIVGGTLRDQETDASYGSFTQLSEGTFQLTTTWDDIDAAHGIVFEVSGSRSFSAVFVDNQERVGVRSLDLDLVCKPAAGQVPPAPGFAVCGDGECRDLGTESDCEGCNMACPNTGRSRCVDGVCEVADLSDCVFVLDFADCEDVCVSQGRGACSSAACGYPTIWYHSLSECEADMDQGSASACNVPLDADGISSYARCCCTG